MRKQSKSKLTVMDTTVAELKEIRKETRTKTYSATIKWLLDHKLETEVIGKLVDIKEINGHTSINETVELLIHELEECLEQRDGQND